MSSRTYLLERDERTATQFAALHPTMLRSHRDIVDALPTATNQDTWIIPRNDLARELVKATAGQSRRFGRLLLLDQTPLQSVPPLLRYFQPVVFAATPCAFLPPEELACVLQSPDRQFLFIGGSVDHKSRTCTLWRGDLSSIVVPFDAFPAAGDGTRPDFQDFSVTDYGQTLRFGRYEAATEAVLYEYDPDYRRHLKARRRAEDTGFGPSLRRLRKQRGLRRSDFAPLSAKTIARLERGEVEKPHGDTLAIIAKKLRVKPDEIEMY